MNDLDLLKNKKIIVERIPIFPHELETVRFHINEKINKLKGIRHRDGLIYEILEIISIKNPVMNMNSLKGELYVDVQFLVNIINLKPQDNLRKCTITIVNKMGIFATKNNIQCIIPSDYLQDNFLTLYKKNDTIDLTILSVESTIYNSQIDCCCKLYSNKPPSQKQLLILIGNELKEMELTQTKEETNINYLKLGIPDKNTIELFDNFIKTYSNKINKFLYPFHDKISDYDQLLSAEIIELIKIFKLSDFVHFDNIITTTPLITKKIEKTLKENLKTSTDSSNLLLSLYSENLDKMAIEIPVILEKNNNEDIIKKISEKKVDNLLIQIPLITTQKLFSLLIFILNKYSKVYIYKPQVSFGSNNLIYIFGKKMIKNDTKFILYDLEKIQDEFIIDLLSFNSFIYKGLFDRCCDLIYFDGINKQ